MVRRRDIAEVAARMGFRVRLRNIAQVETTALVRSCRGSAIL